jgi:hypothetical protein
MDCGDIAKLMTDICKKNNKPVSEKNNENENTYCYRSVIWYNEKCDKNPNLEQNLEHTLEQTLEKTLEKPLEKTLEKTLNKP